MKRYVAFFHQQLGLIPYPPMGPVTETRSKYDKERGTSFRSSSFFKNLYNAAADVNYNESCYWNQQLYLEGMPFHYVRADIWRGFATCRTNTFPADNRALFVRYSLKRQWL